MFHAYSLAPPDGRWTAFAQNVKPVFILAWIFIAVFPVLWLINTRKILRDPRVKNGFKYHVSDEGVRVEGSAGVSEFNWTAFVEAREISNGFLLFVTRTSFHVIPRRCFTTNEEVLLFRKIIRANIPKAKLKQGTKL
jgi:hypothetical protein